jgi:hypothetical protein
LRKWILLSILFGLIITNGCGKKEQNKVSSDQNIRKLKYEIETIEIKQHAIAAHYLGWTLARWATSIKFNDNSFTLTGLKYNCKVLEVELNPDPLTVTDQKQVLKIWSKYVDIIKAKIKSGNTSNNPIVLKAFDLGTYSGIISFLTVYSIFSKVKNEAITNKERDGCYRAIGQAKDIATEIGFPASSLEDLSKMQSTVSQAKIFSDFKPVFDFMPIWHLKADDQLEKIIDRSRSKKIN